jgi:hypothetical protein
VTDGSPTVENRHWYRGKKLPKGSIYIGRGTPLGNPFTVTQHGASALGKYRHWLWSKIKKRDPSVMRALRAIRPDSILICSCKPRPCHGDVVQRAWIWMREQGILDP